MYPQADLIQLAARKEALRLAIAGQRGLLIRDLETILRPVRWLDRANGVRVRLMPFWSAVSIPLLWWYGRSRPAVATTGWRSWIARAPRWLRMIRIATSVLRSN